MTAFGPTPIDPRGVHAGLAATQGVRTPERSKPTTDEAQRTRDAAQQRVAGAESESAVRRTADEHAEEDTERHRDRRDGRRDEFHHDEQEQRGKQDGSTPKQGQDQRQRTGLPTPVTQTARPSPKQNPPDGKPHIDVRG